MAIPEDIRLEAGHYLTYLHNYFILTATSSFIQEFPWINIKTKLLDDETGKRVWIDTRHEAAGCSVESHEFVISSPSLYRLSGEEYQPVWILFKGKWGCSTRLSVVAH
ncbi:hypothetical protein CC1G_04078 [Coprinopsis cinerea okayama7|uniref:Uncharacterized protein n=1 Tax=Coprinopsis cinerea (strain Okayama-7 / 130 / ATCC MYA-4618 / FGSC 9003) TaxID=240176 RepID=A8NVW0_COPC7|nr:hypothetical protein CC1G_04078 [Coprinopsis cinerea okayama7\|eukprot:XP_001836765.2 hypothetical protein CC1G_04078 [Coprinopsis cinerea okayama7\